MFLPSWLLFTDAKLVLVSNPASLSLSDLRRIRKEARESTFENQITYLQTRVFKSLVEKDCLQRIGQVLIEQEVSLPRKTVILNLGEVSEHLYLIKAGSIRMMVLAGDGKRQKTWHCIALLGEGEFIGEDILTKSGENKYSAVVDSMNCTLYRIQADWLKKQVGYNATLEYFFRQVVTNRSARREAFVAEGATYKQYLDKVIDQETRRKELARTMPTDPVEVIKAKKMRACTPMRTSYLFKRMVGDKVFNFLSKSAERSNRRPSIVDFSEEHHRLFCNRLERKLLVSKPPPDSTMGKLKVAESRSRVRRFEELDKTIYRPDTPSTDTLNFEIIVNRSSSVRAKTSNYSRREPSLDLTSLDGRLASTEGELRGTSTSTTFRTKTTILSSQHHLFRRKPSRPEIKAQYYLDPKEQSKKLRIRTILR